MLCAACAESEPHDELAGETELDGEAGKGDTTDAFTYFIVNRHGSGTAAYYMVERYNRTLTDCRTGEVANRCFIEKLDWSTSPYTATQTAAFDDRMSIDKGGSFLVRAEIAAGGASLVVTEAWMPGSPSGLIDGPAVLVEDNGRRCVTSPCANLTETRINANARTADLTALDLTASGADDAAIATALSRLGEDRALIVVGERF